MRWWLRFSMVGLVVGLAGCPDGGDASMDASMERPMDAPMPMGSDAPMSMGSDAPMSMGSDAPMSMGSDAPMSMGSDAPMPMGPTWAAVHAQLTMRCSGCHSTMRLGGHNIAHPNAAMAYMESQLTARSCSGMTQGACSAQRVRMGNMPPGGIPEPARTDLVNLIEAWVAAGQPGP